MRTNYEEKNCSVDVSVIVLGGGGVHRNEWLSDFGIDHWDLLLASDSTLAQAWVRRIREDAGKLGLDWSSDMGLVVSDPVPSDRVSVAPGLELVTECRGHRGTAGVIADRINECEESGSPLGEWILVIELSACPAIDLKPLFSQVQSKESIFIGVSDLDRTAGCMLIRKSIFDSVPKVGFCDLKEQLIGSQIAEDQKVKAVNVCTRSFRVRGRVGWLESVAAWNGIKNPQVMATVKDHSGRVPSAASMVTKSAQVDGARIVSSVVLDGAKVGSGAVVARSIIGPQVVVPPGAVIADMILTKRDRPSSSRRRRRFV